LEDTGIRKGRAGTTMNSILFQMRNHLQLGIDVDGRMDGIMNGLFLKLLKKLI
jgi:hypothetical protein